MVGHQLPLVLPEMSALPVTSTDPGSTSTPPVTTTLPPDLGEPASAGEPDDPASEMPASPEPLLDVPASPDPSLPASPPPSVTYSSRHHGLRKPPVVVSMPKTVLPSADGTTPVPMARAIALELELLGSHGMAAHTYPPMLELVRSGVLRPDLLVTSTITLDATPDALAAMGTAPGAGVTVIEPWS